MVHLQHRPARAPPSLASTPEKAPEPSEGPDSGQQQRSRGEGQAPTGAPQKGGGLGWGVVTRVASGLLGSGAKKGGNEKKVGVSDVVSIDQWKHAQQTTLDWCCPLIPVHTSYHCLYKLAIDYAS